MSWNNDDWRPQHPLDNAWSDRRNQNNFCDDYTFQNDATRVDTLSFRYTNRWEEEAINERERYNKLQYYKTDYTKNGLVLNQRNGRYIFGNWGKKLVDSMVAGAGAGVAFWFITSGWGMSSQLECFIAGGSGALGITNFRYEIRRAGFAVDQAT